MEISHAGKYAEVIQLARQCNATEVSIQHHIFVNFTTLGDAQAFMQYIRIAGMRPLWDDVNTKRPFVPFEVVVERF